MTKIYRFFFLFVAFFSLLSLNFSSLYALGGARSVVASRGQTESVNHVGSGIVAAPRSCGPNETLSYSNAGAVCVANAAAGSVYSSAQRPAVDAAFSSGAFLNNSLPSSNLGTNSAYTNPQRSVFDRDVNTRRVASLVQTPTRATRSENTTVIHHSSSSQRVSHARR